ncbi:hypothetical protein LIER_04166 [Lithospermum erythrorhizon]|uniref:CP-type G domain-containing protein n=1 Tax=Lithospermum erythrorhizon TaxID=34254 RepID=A0AAV3NX11_LITER
MTSTIIQKLGNTVKQIAKNKSSSWWYTPHMSAASRAIAQRIPLVDFVLEVRDARIPLSSAYEELRNFSTSSRHIVVLNKAELVNRSELKEWMRYFEQQNNICLGVNAHNKDNIREFLNFIQARVRELLKTERSRHTLTFMLVGIPNVGKSALANSLHQMGRITAAEKGKLKHGVVSPHPGDTKNISSLKIASHPNIYVLDTPGVLSPEILDAEVCCKLALTGAIDDIIVGPTELAQYFLSILNLGKEYPKWEKFSNKDISNSSESDTRLRRQYPSDHTQDFVVNNVRKTLYEAISSFDGDLGSEDDLAQLIETELRLLQKAFHIPQDLKEDGHAKVATKLINLYRTGRLGHYVLDPVLRQS